MTSTGTKIIKPLVYQIINLMNGKFYIGVTKLGIRVRRLQHLKEARRGKLEFPLYQAIRKYGEDSFAFIVLREFDSYEEALAGEVLLISIMNPGYNATKGGDGVSYWTGKTRDVETNRKISATKTGVARGYTPPHALEVFKENMRRAARARRKPVICLNDGLVFDSAQTASLHYKFDRTSVASVACGQRKQIFGLKFEYMQVN